MEPTSQVEIQLGHMCNNRCVFCVSGQRTGLGMAHPLAAEPILARITEAYARGERKITLLGGEPTLQPAFLDIVRHTVALGFDEIVIFTNGVKSKRAGFIDEVLATGGRFTWRISIQGGDEASHDRTTQRSGAFARIVRSMELLRERGERITVNMCVVQSNFDSVRHFPELLLPFGVEQLHLDMVRPKDAGERTEAELRAMIPRYTDMVPALTAMVEGFTRAGAVAAGARPSFDLNIGNLPYCIAPELAPWIHHDGESTTTIAIDGDHELSEGWDKYDVKRRDKLKPESCRACLFDARCSGVFETYRDFYGLEELRPVDAARLERADPERRLLPLHLTPVLAALGELTPPPPFTAFSARESGDDEVTVTFTSKDTDDPEYLAVALRPPGPGLASFERFSLHLRRRPRSDSATRAGLTALWGALSAHGGGVRHPLGDDAIARLSPSVVARLERLRDAAPFGSLRWNAATTGGAGRLELHLSGPDGEAIVFWLDERRGEATGGYRLDRGGATREVIDGLTAMMEALRAPATGLTRAGGHGAR